jgi:hypothetical protein
MDSKLALVNPWISGIFFLAIFSRPPGHSEFQLTQHLCKSIIDVFKHFLFVFRARVCDVTSRKLREQKVSRWRTPDKRLKMPEG